MGPETLIAGIKYGILIIRAFQGQVKEIFGAFRKAMEFRREQSMSILEEVISLLSPLKIPIETGTFSEETPDSYIVLIPLLDTYPLNADDKPQIDKQELRITLYTKSNYIHLKNQIIARLISNYFYITERRYGGYDADTGYHQYTIDVAKTYEIEQEED